MGERLGRVKNIIKYSSEPKPNDVPALSEASSMTARGTPNVSVERCRGVHKLERPSPACWGCCSNRGRAHTRDIHGKLLLRPHDTLRLNLMSCKPMNSAYLVSDTVSFCEILFYKQRNISNQMALFTRFKVSFDSLSDIKRHCSSTQSAARGNRHNHGGIFLINVVRISQLMLPFKSEERNRQFKGGWRLNYFPGQPVPMLDNPFSEVKFPNIQSKPPLAQLEAISSCPITCYLGEETDPHLSTTSFQAEQPQFPQLLLIRLLLQTLHQLRCPSLDTLQHLHVSLVVGGPKLNTVFEVQPHQCRVQGHNHFPSPAGHAIFDTSQDAIDDLGHLGTLLAHVQPAVNQHTQVLFCLAAFQPLFPKPVALHGAVVTQVQDPTLGLVEPHTIGPSPCIQPVQVPLQSLPPLQINTPAQLGVICKLTEGALDPLVQIIDKDIKQNWPQHRALGNTTCDRPPTGFNSIHHHSLGPAIQQVLYSAKSMPVQAISSQFLQENAVGNRVKGFTEV
ncbi:hypothetical protein QYF61_018760 [Mycteria americana]|uniref:Uncharacterized protein n=1 Tax=Mycteria americana TaxID=33587 RepID=A0AAN7SL60_MYCAM|nr:hypothetical protein QYF61_018760 [Mycteria americana]